MDELLGRIRTFTATRGNLSELARRAGVNHVTILKIVHGTTKNPGVLTLQKIEAALDVLCPVEQPAAAGQEA